MDKKDTQKEITIETPICSMKTETFTVDGIDQKISDLKQEQKNAQISANNQILFSQKKIDELLTKRSAVEKVIMGNTNTTDAIVNDAKVVI